MGFDTQPNLWQCGPYALKHALIMLGVLVDEHRISRIAGTDASGTDEEQLARAARKYGCELSESRNTEPEEARRELADCLHRGIPCLMCVHQWRHWVAVVKEERGKFILLDSEDAAVLTICTWPQLRGIWGCRPKIAGVPEPDAEVFDLYPVVPRFRVQLRARFSLARARFLRRPENRDLARQWNEYLEDLLNVCTPRTPLSERVISLGEFLRRHEGMIVDQVAYWHGKAPRRALVKVLENMRFVADTHGLVVRHDDEKRTIAGLTALLTLWAVRRGGVGPVYGK